MSTFDNQMENYREQYVEPASELKPKTTHDAQVEQLRREYRPMMEALKIPSPEPSSIMEGLAESLGK